MSVSPIRQGFVKRLIDACDESETVPSLNHGRYVFIAEQLNVSDEAVRKWFAGIAMPRRDLLRKLAQMLRKDELWLERGIKPTMGRAETTAFAREISGAVLVVAGMVQLAGGSCAWPSEEDPRKGTVDFYTIVQGRQYSVRVCLARGGEDGRYEIDAPADLDGLTLIGVIPLSRRGRYDFIFLPVAEVAQQKNRRQGDYVVSVQKTEAGYQTGRKMWPTVKNFADLRPI